MATTTTRQFDNLTNVLTEPIEARPFDAGGKRRALWFAHTCEEETVGSTIKLSVIPAGARVVGLSFQSQDLSGGAATLRIGDSAQTDRLVADFDVSAAVASGSVKLQQPTVEIPDQGYGYVYTARTEIIATVGGAALNTGKFWGTITYLLD